MIATMTLVSAYREALLASWLDSECFYECFEVIMKLKSFEMESSNSACPAQHSTILFKWIHRTIVS